jgi:hypothetical protein
MARAALRRPRCQPGPASRARAARRGRRVGVTVTFRLRADRDRHGDLRPPHRRHAARGGPPRSQAPTESDADKADTAAMIRPAPIPVAAMGGPEPPLKDRGRRLGSPAARVTAPRGTAGRRIDIFNFIRPAGPGGD